MKHKWDILCIHETHRDEHVQRPHIEGLHSTIEVPHSKGGSLIFTRTDLVILSVDITTNNDIDVLAIESDKFKLTSVYKASRRNF